MGTTFNSCSFPAEKEEKCPLNPTTKKRRRLRPLVKLLRRPNSRKMLERLLQERRKKCKPREPLKGKRNQGLGKTDTCKKQFKCDKRLDISLDRRQIPKPPTEGGLENFVIKMSI